MAICQSLRESPLVHRSFSDTSAVAHESYPPQRPSVGFRNQSSGNPPPESPSAYGYRIFSVPNKDSPLALKAHSQPPSKVARGPLYFTKEERLFIDALVRTKVRYCHHPNCTDCTHTEYAYHENKAMATSLPPEERQRIINNNRSLRNIKNVGFTGRV